MSLQGSQPGGALNTLASSFSSLVGIRGPYATGRTHTCRADHCDHRCRRHSVMAWNASTRYYTWWSGRASATAPVPVDANPQPRQLRSDVRTPADVASTCWHDVGHLVIGSRAGLSPIPSLVPSGRNWHQSPPSQSADMNFTLAQCGTTPGPGHGVQRPMPGTAVR